MTWLRLALLVIDLAGSIVRWIEREKLHSKIERELFRERVRKHNEAVFEAKEIRARIRAELDADPGKLREHPDAHFRD